MRSRYVESSMQSLSRAELPVDSVAMLTTTIVVWKLAGSIWGTENHMDLEGKAKANDILGLRVWWIWRK